MTGLKKTKPKDFTINKQLLRAVSWLRSNEVIKSDADICRTLRVSKATLSAYMNNARPVAGTFAYKFEETYLRNEHLTLQDFERHILLEQLKQTRVRHQDTPAVLEFLSTEVIKLEGGVQIILEKLDELNKQYGELLKIVKKIGQ